MVRRVRAVSVRPVTLVVRYDDSDKSAESTRLDQVANMPDLSAIPLRISTGDLRNKASFAGPKQARVDLVLNSRIDRKFTYGHIENIQHLSGIVTSSNIQV